MRLSRAFFITLLFVALAGFSDLAAARITKIQINSRAIAFGGASFGSVGQYETLRGMVEFNFDFWINKPVDMTKANGTLLHDVPNRGSVRSLELNVRGAGDMSGASGQARLRGDFDAAEGTTSGDYFGSLCTE